VDEQPFPAVNPQPCDDGESIVRRTSTSPAEAKKRLLAQVSSALDLVRPALRSDGGDVELLDIDVDGVVHIRLLGACIGCPSSDMTLTLGIERTVKEQVPQITDVVCDQP